MYPNEATEINIIGKHDIRKAMSEFGPASENAARDVRFITRYYYAIQDDRKRTHSQLRESLLRNENNLLLKYLAAQTQEIEKAVKYAMESYTDQHEVGHWLKQIYGIGPVIAAGIVAHIDIKKAVTSGHIESFAGYNPNMVWPEKTKRPYNADLKVLFYHAGCSFMKFSGNDDCVYGKWFLQKLGEYKARNEAGEYAAQAAEGLKKYKKETVAYATCLQGKLPGAQIVARARRWTIKLFISHLHEYWYTKYHGEPPAKPYAISILGHAHHIRFGEYPENWQELKTIAQKKALENQMS